MTSIWYDFCFLSNFQNANESLLFGGFSQACRASDAFRSLLPIIKSVDVQQRKRGCASWNADYEE